MKIVFATSLATSSCGGTPTHTLTHATIERQNRPDFDGVEIVNRAGVTMYLDKDAAVQLYVALRDMVGTKILP